jgi:prepilin-type N-terminal cleavage/methylation domain-containing protein
MSRRNRHARGVTLIELIVGILLLAVTLTLTLLFIDKIRAQVGRQKVQNNLRRIGEGVRVYHDVYQSLPSQPKDNDE